MDGNLNLFDDASGRFPAAPNSVRTGGVQARRLVTGCSFAIPRAARIRMATVATWSSMSEALVRALGCAKAMSMPSPPRR
jgi:hypothetical protein